MNGKDSMASLAQSADPTAGGLVDQVMLLSPASRDVLLQILQETRRIKEEERKSRELELEILRIKQQASDSAPSTTDKRALADASKEDSSLLNSVSTLNAPHPGSQAPLMDNLLNDLLTKDSTSSSSPNMDLQSLLHAVPPYNPSRKPSFLQTTSDTHSSHFSSTTASPLLEHQVGLPSALGLYPNALLPGYLSNEPPLSSPLESPYLTHTQLESNTFFDIPSQAFLQDACHLDSNLSSPSHVSLGDQDLMALFQSPDSFQSSRRTSASCAQTPSMNAITLESRRNSMRPRPLSILTSPFSPLQMNLSPSSSLYTSTPVQEGVQSNRRKLSKSEPHSQSPRSSKSQPLERKEVFKQAAARGSTRRKTLEQVCHCIGCKVEIGTLYLRGKQEFFESEYTVDVKCLKCCSPPVPPLERRSSFSEGSKKRTRETPLVECEVCKKVIASGGVRKGSLSTEEWEEPCFSVEMVCTICVAKYMFCSECGGGGKRTGKWRPIQLFQDKRKTCSLPHIRVGDAPIVYRTLEIPREMNVNILRGLKDVYWDSLLSLLAVPVLMETPKYNGRYASLMQDIEKSWNETVESLLVPTVGIQSHGKRYLTIAWIEKTIKTKAKTRQVQVPLESGVPWLTRLALEGIVAPCNIDKTEPVETRDGNEKCFVAFSIAEWDQSHRTLFMMQMAPRSVHSPVVESYGELIRRALERVQADARRDNVGPIEHLCCWTRGETSRLQCMPQLLGFFPKEEYLRKYPHVDRTTFERPDYPVLYREGVYVYCAAAKTFLQMIALKKKSLIVPRNS